MSLLMEEQAMNNHHFPFTLYIPTDNEKERLQKWLKMWNVAKELDAFPESATEESTIDTSDDERFKEKLSELVRDFDEFPQAGEIRLLSPEFDEGICLPKYVAILKEWEDDTFLVAPFSPFSIPAVQGEFQTGKEHFSLANLELWNAMIAPFDVLEKSWIADGLTQEQIDDAFSVFKFISTGADLPERLKERIGSPIFFENDPRNQYQNEEELVYSLFRVACEETVSQEKPSPIFILYQTVKDVIQVYIEGNAPTEYYPMAAGTADKADFAIPTKIQDNRLTLEFEIVVEWNEEEEVTEFWIRGERASEICSKDNELIVIFENGERVVHHFDNGDNFFLKTPKKEYAISDIRFSLK